MLWLATATEAAVPRSVERDFVFEHGGIRLAGVVILPGEGGPFPGAVLIQGSGTSDRSNAWARAIAQRLAAGGIAVLLPDKRGSGASGGDWRTADFGDLADDALATLELLRGLPEVAADRVGFVGLSQGGHIAPLAAAKSDSVRFVASVSGGATTMAETVAWEVEQAWRRVIANDATVERALAFLRQSDQFARDRSGWEEYLKMRAALERDFGPRAVATFPDDPNHWYWAWWGGVVDYHPMPYWRRVEQPALFVYGALDDNTPVSSSVERVRRELLGAGRDVTVQVFPDSGHGLRTPGGRELLPQFVELLTTWILRHAGR